MEVAIDHLVEALEQFQLAAHAVRGVIVKPGVTQQQGKHGLRQQHQSMFPPGKLGGGFTFNQPPVIRERRQLVRFVGERQADPRQPEGLPGAGVKYLKQRPDQILMHRQHMTVAVRFGKECVRHRRRGENKQRRLH